ncbi:MAG: hypothetical protein ACU0CC_19950 [Sagittula sp.]|jgi:hypothetical protein|uniref:hypothetical protein n=1 Tax=unclassified Sagittula TaxID=2624628 RepID=UPI0024C30068|nr:hypothetical protein [Sagittula sp. MA-2]WHZ34802.1 hypothetical protein QNI11_19480 [Sagittula sp. MA-2]
MNGFTPNDCGTIELWLLRSDPDEIWHLANARLRGRMHSNRMVPDAPVPLEEVFQPVIVQILLGHLQCVEDTAVFSQSDFQVRIPGLALHGLRVLTHFNRDGHASANIRFVRSVGDSSAIFQKSYRTDPAADHSLSDMALPVLQELLCPALEAFDHILEHGLSEQQTELLQARVKTMRSRRDELSDYISLLTRYLEAVGNDPEEDRDALHIGLDRDVPAVGSAGRNRDIAARVMSRKGTLHWTAKRGMVRGDNLGILHGHQKAIDTIS